MCVYVCTCSYLVPATMGIGGSVAQGREYRDGVLLRHVAPCRCGASWWGGYVQVRWCDEGFEEYEKLRLGITCMDTLLDLVWKSWDTQIPDNFDELVAADCTQSVLLPPSSPATTEVDPSSPSPVSTNSSPARSRSRSPHR